MGQICLLLIICCACGSPATYDHDRASATTLNHKQLKALQNLLEHRVKIPNYSKPKAFLNVLEDLQKQLPQKLPRAIRIDSRAFTETRQKRIENKAISFDELPPQSRCFSLCEAIRLAVLALNEKDIVVAIRPTHMTITKQFAQKLHFYTMRYEVGEYMAKSSMLRACQANGHWPLVNVDPRAFQPDSVPDLIACTIQATVDPPHWKLDASNRGDIQVQNTTLTIRTSLERHLAIKTVFAALRRIADLAVVMQTDLYEVDRAFFDKHISALFNKGQNKRRFAFVPSKKTAELLKKNKPVIKNEKVKINPDEWGTFFALKRTFTYNAKLKNVAKPVIQSATHGFSFNVKPIICDDRFHLRLHIRRKTVELLKIERDKFINKEQRPSVVETPVFRKDNAAFAVDIDDVESLLLDVDFGPDNPQKIYVALLTPMIWIEEEQELGPAKK